MENKPECTAKEDAQKHRAFQLQESREGTELRQKVKAMQNDTLKANAALRDLDLTVDCKIWRNQHQIVQSLAVSMMDVSVSRGLMDSDLTECLIAAFEAGQQSVLINPPDYGLFTGEKREPRHLMAGMKGGAE